MPNVLIFGCGYLGRRAAKSFHNANYHVYATTRSASKATEFAAAGWQPLLGDITSRERFPEIPPIDFDFVLYAVGRGRQSRASHAEVFAGGLQQVIQRLSTRIHHLAYVSSTGVYGDGDWVDEDTPTHPATDSARACLAAEQLLQTPAWNNRATVLRLAGIYGPGRVPRLDAIRDGTPLAVPVDGYLNLIHVDDAVGAVVRLAEITGAAAACSPPQLLVVSDGNPVLRRDYIRKIASLIEAPEPQFVEPDPHAPVTRRAATSKRIRNQRMLKTLQITLQYPSYREGLVHAIGIEP